MSSEIFRSSGSFEVVLRSRQISTMNTIAREQQLLCSGDSNTRKRGDGSCAEPLACYFTPSPNQDCGALSWAVSRWLSPNVEVQFDRKPVRMGFCGGPDDNGSGFSPST
jgi:hypothetical protein